MWTFLIFHVSEHIWTLFTISGNPTLSQIDSNEIFHTIWQQCAGGLLWRSPRNSQPGGEANLTQVAAQLSRRDSSEGGGGFAVCLRFKDGPWLIFLRQKQRHETERGGCVCVCVCVWGVQNRTPQRSCQVWCLTVRTPATSTPPLRILGSPTSGSLKITRAINKQTEAITGRQRRGEGLD